MAARWKTVAAQAALTFVTAWIAAEAVLWIRDSFQRPQPAAAGTAGFDPRFPAPYLMFQAQPDRSVDHDQGQGRNGELSRIQTNSLGFRHAEEIALEKPAGETRVFALGGSVLFNGLRTETTITGFLERALNEGSAGSAPAEGGKRTYRVINASIVSADSDQELAMLVHRIADLSPDVVLVIDGFNDIWTRLYYEPRIGHPINWTSFENAYGNNRMLRASLDRLTPLDHLLAMSKVATRINPSWKLENRIIRSLSETAPRPTATAEISEEILHQAAVRLIVNWIKMFRFTEALGARMVGILQPINPGTKENQLVARYYELVNREIDLLRSRGYPFFSFDGTLDDHPELFRDVVHTWDDAHPLYARRIHDLLAAEGYLAGG